MQRIVVALGVLLLVALAWTLLQQAEEPLLVTEDAETPTPIPPATAPLAVATPLPAARANATAGVNWWLASLGAEARRPLVAAEDDPTALVLRGRVTVRQRPWLHPAGIEIRLTRSWLDTVLPVETGAPERQEPTTKTDEQGRFALRCQPDPGELFLLIDRDGAWMDFQKVPSQVTWFHADFGEIFLDDRGGITGTLVDGQGQPVANAAVRAVDAPLLDATSGLDDLRAERTKGLDLFSASGSLRSGPMPDWVIRRDEFLPFPRTTTDAAGRFLLRGLRPGSHEVFCQHAQGVGNRRDVLVAPLRDTEIGAITLAPTTPVALRFVDQFDQPWVGARVAFVQATLGFGPPVQTTNALGEIKTAIPNPEAASIVFSMPGNGPWIEVWRPPDVGATGATTLEEAANIRASMRGNRFRFELGRRSGAKRTSTLVVGRPRELVVHLVDTIGQPLTGGSVRTYVTVDAFRPVDRALPQFMQPREREPGRYVGLHPCSVVVVASVPGMAPGVAVAAADQGELAVTMLPLQTMTVRTHDMRGTPIAGAAVRIQVHGHPDLEFPGAQWAALANDRLLVGSTDEDGKLEVSVWPTFFSLQASHRDFASSAGPRILAVPGLQTNLMLKRRASVIGYLTVEQRAAPAGFRVRAQLRPPFGNELHDSGWLDSQLAVTGPDGGFAFRSLCSGIWKLTPELPGTPSPSGAVAPAEVFLSREVLLDEEQEIHCGLEAKRSPLIAPQIVGVVRSNGTELPGALVRLREIEEPARDFEREARRKARRKSGEGMPRALPAVEPAETSHWPHRTTTDQYGDFRFTDLKPSSEYELRIDVPLGGRLQFIERRVVRAGHPDERGKVPSVVVEMKSGSIRLMCMNQGRPFGNRMVRLRQVLEGGSEGARFDLLTEANGECIADGLPAGTWTVEPTHGGRFDPATFTLGAGEASGAVMYFVN